MRILVTGVKAKRAKGDHAIMDWNNLLIVLLRESWQGGGHYVCVSYDE
jgi:hypothetical protein